jgi:hypothetical protein
MCKVVFVLVCVLISEGVFAQAELLEYFERTTSEGKYGVGLYYAGKNLGQQNADNLIKSERSMYTARTDIKLSNVKLDLIRQALDLYGHSRGDTYVITLSDTPYFSIRYVVEYTSTTQYTYWIWSVYSANGMPIMPPFLPPYHGDPNEGPPPLPSEDAPPWHLLD